MTIHKKLLRDIYENRGANAAALVVIIIGVMIFTGAWITMDTLVLSKDLFYEQGKFPDLYAELIAAPKKVLDSLKEIPEVEAVEGRLVQDVKVPDTSKVIRLVSRTTQIGKDILIEGNLPKAGEEEFLLDNKFAQSNRYQVGDKIPVIAEGKIKYLRVCGIAYSPETIYPIKDISSIFPDARDFGIGFIEFSTLHTLTGKNYFNQILFELKDKNNLEMVQDEVKKRLSSYGLLRQYPMEDQSSNVMVDGEIKELKATMLMMPLIFLSVASLVMGIMLKRMIEQQRGQIGILKAFGYADWTVGLHYALYCFILGLSGGIVGSLLGCWFSDVMLGVYRDFFNMKYVNDKPLLFYFIQGLILSGGFSMAVGFKNALKAVQINPSEAMREEAPKDGVKSVMEYAFFFPYLFNTQGKMSIRNISRNKKRSFFVVLGFTLAFAISVLPWTFLFLMQEMVMERYEQVERYDAKVFLSNLQDKAESEREIAHFDGILLSQGILDIPVTLIREGLQEEIQMIGIDPENELYTIMDDEKNKILVRSGGVILSHRLSEKLGADVGDTIWVESPHARYKEDKTAIKVKEIVQQGIGMNAYMEIDDLSKLLGYKPIINVILLDVEKDEVIDRLRDKYQDAPKVVGIQSKKENIRQIEHRMKVMYISMYFMAVLASAMSFSIVYNTYIVVLMERQREFSTLMVLGLKDREVLSIISLEQWLMSFLGIFLGIPLAKALIIFISRGLSTDMFTLPTTMKVESLLISGFLMSVSILLAQQFAGRKITRLNIVDALKSGE